MEWDSTVCEGAVAISGDEAAWATYSSGTATIVVPSSATYGTYDLTFTYSDAASTNKASGTSDSSATGDVVVTLSYTAEAESTTTTETSSTTTTKP
jgi:hypothetical protein